MLCARWKPFIQGCSSLEALQKPTEKTVFTKGEVDGSVRGDGRERKLRVSEAGDHLDVTSLSRVVKSDAGTSGMPVPGGLVARSRISKFVKYMLHFRPSFFRHLKSCKPDKVK